MKKVRFLSLISFVGLVLFGFIFTFNSCEIGLGASVDTQAPVVSFAETTVGSGGVIRDSFMVYGNWTDDGTIKEVTATLNKTDGSKVSFETKGKVETTENGSGTWNAVFDPPKDKIPDGSYELSITMEDKGNHKSTITRAVIIDNTPPLVVLTRPGTKLNDTSFDSYGQKFSLEGKAADDNDVSLVEVNIFEDAACTKLLKTIPIQNVPLTIDLDVAEFSATELNDYAEIYKILKDGLADKKGGTAYRYCTLTIYDGAQRYPADGSAQTEADQKGNQTNTYYVNDDEIAKLFTEYKITELYHILNESFGSSAGRAISVDSVKTKLEQQAITSSQFTINPENSPTFVVNSRSPLEEGTTLQDAKYFITSGSSSLQVEISAGLDKHAILKDSVGIYLQECDINGVVSDSAEKIYLVAPVSEANPNAHDESIVEIVQSGTTYKFTTVETLTPVNFPLLQVTKYYKVFVEGKDVMTNDILPKDGQIFAFYLKPDTKFIEVSVTDVKPEWLSWTDGANAANKTYSARITFSGGDATSYDVYRNGVNIGLNVNSPFNDTINITSAPEDHPTEIIYKIKGKDANNDENGAESTDYKVVPDRKYDNAIPQVWNITAPTTEDTENQTFQFSGKAKDTDSGVATVYLKITNADGTNVQFPITWTAENWEKNIKQSQLTSEGPKTVEVWAEDKVGLKTEPKTEDGTKFNWVFDTAAPTLNFTTEPASIVGGLITLSGTASDGYGVEKVEVIQQKLGNNDAVVSTITQDATGKTSWSTSDLPFKNSSTSYSADEIKGDTHPADGKYKYTIKVTDKAGKTTEKSVTVTLNTTAATLTMDTDLDVWFASTNVSVSGTASAVSPATVSKVYYYIDKNSTAPTYPTTGVDTVSNWTSKGWASAIGTTNWAANLPADQINNSDSNILYMATVDNVKNVGKFDPFTIKVDSTSPELKQFYYNIDGTDIFKKAEGNIYVNGSKNLIVYGQYYDDESKLKEALSFTLKNSAIATDKIEIKYSTHAIVENPDKETLDGFTWGDFSESAKYFKVTFDASVFNASNEGDLKVSGKNGAGTPVDAKICSISFDNKVPELANVQFKSVENKFNVYEDPTTHKYYINKDYKFNITGVATDVGGGVQDVKLIIGSAAPKDRDTSNNPNSWTFSNVDLRGQTGNSVTLNLKVIDIAGNEKPYSYTFIFDQTEPEALHWADAKGKDVYFRIGNADNDYKKDQTKPTGYDTSKVESGEDWDASLDTGVGSKYSYGSYGKDSTIEFRGTFEETGSGLKMIYYKIFDLSTTTESDITTAITQLQNKTLAPDGSFEPIAATDQVEKRIPYNVDTNGTKKSVKIKSNYRAEISGFNGDNNCLILLAEDNVGNRKADALVVNRTVTNGTITNSGSGDITWNSTKAYYGINKDTVVPGITTNNTQGTFTNTKQDVSVSGTASDAASGLGSVKIYIDEEVEPKVGTNKIRITWSTTIKVNDYTPGDTYNWSTDIPGSVFTNVKSGTSLTVYATAKDKAGEGNEKTISAATITIDTAAPTVTINTPSDADTTTQDVDVNGNITLAGTADDFYGVGEVLGLCFIKASSATKPSDQTPTTTVTQSNWTAPSGWTKINITPSGTTSWTFADIDTAGLTGVSNGDTVWFTVAVQDKAGNIGYATPQKVIVDQNTDRPIVKFNNLTNVGTTANPIYSLMYGTNSQLEGNVSDDDAKSSGTDAGVVNIFVVSKNPLTAEPTESDSDDDGWSKSENGNEITWTHASNGTTTYNKVTGDYTYTPTDTGDGPKTAYFYIKDKGNKEFYTTHTEVLNKPYQQHKGESGTRQYNTGVISYRSDGTNPRIEPTKIQIGTAWEDVNTSIKIGGSSRQNAKFKIQASDENGIAKIRLTLDYNLKTDAENAEKRHIKYISIDSTDDSDTEFTKNGSVDENDDGLWTTGEISVSDWKTDTVTGTVEVFDNSGLLATASPSFFVDNSGPTINITSPSSTEELTGKQKFAGVSTESGNAGLDKTYWLIPTAAQRAMENDDLAQEDGWNDDLNGTSSYSAWEFELSGTTLGNNTSNATTSSEGVYTLPFYVKATDKLGNFTIDRSKTIKYNPEGDRPKTKITYPTDADYKEGENFLTLGGAIRITGTSEIPSGPTTVKAVYLQVINGTGNSTDLSTYTNNSTYVARLKYNNNPCYSVNTASQAATDLGFTSLNFATGVNSDNWWGIKVNNAASWNFTINNNGEMNPTSGTINYVAIRACAVNAEGKVGTWTDWYYLNIDNTAPTQEAYMYQFTSAPTQNCTADDQFDSSNIVASNAYTNGMYLKGAWYLTVKLDDESAINSYQVKKGVDTLTADTDYFASTKVSGSGNGGNEKIQYLFIPVDTSNPAVAYTVTVNDTEHSISKTYSLNIDNDAPVIESVYKGEVYNAANELTAGENKITDSNYIYTLGSKIDESASGFERFVFYYVRANAIDGKTYATEALLDPLITTGASDSKVVLTGLTARSFTQGSSTFKLYSKAIAGTLGANGFTFTPSEEEVAKIVGNSHIRKGGLIEANGILRKIEAIDSTTGEITFDTSSGVTGATSATVYFPYAQVVDNTANESTTNNTGTSFEFKNNSDDGDGMPESVGGSKVTGYNLTATIHSKNIPDGPCALVVLAFDKAGNVSGQTYQVKIENSAPRLAKVWLGTDLNSNGSWQDNEFVGYDLYNMDTDLGVTASGVKETQTIHTAAAGSAYKIKDKLAVIAEIVGGNGDIMMVYGKSATDTTPVTQEAGKKATLDETTTITDLVTSNKIGTVTYNNQPNVTTSLKAYTLTNAQLVTTVSEANDGTNKKASFTFWDSTDELTQGTDSQNCVLLVDDFTIDLVDGVQPNVVIAPFFWNDKDDNSLYKNSRANGHIELESDLTDTVKSTYGTDPKVSGKIVLRGTAYDDKLLKTLQFSMTNFDSGEIKTFATYDATSGNWEITKVGTPTAAEPTMTTNYYEVTVTPDYLDQRGHKVSWEIAIDTSHLSDVAHIDADFTVIAIDNANGSSEGRDTSETAGDATLHRPTYTMDVVPYITDVKRNTGYNTHRSGMGNYPLMREETGNTLTGFNLGVTDSETPANTTARLYISSTSNAITGLSVEDLTVSTSGNTATFKIPATAVDGYLQYYVKSGTDNVPAFNNMNKDVTYTKEEGDTRWYDDRYVRIWQSNANDKFAASYPTYPAMAMGSNGDLFMSYTFYSKSVVYINQLMSNVKTEIFTAGDQPEETDIMVNGTNDVNVIYQANHHQSGKQANWTAAVGSGSGSINLYNSSAPNCNSYAVGKYWRFEGTWHNQMLQQLKNAKVATSGKPADGNIVYHTIWYDKITKAIKYSNVESNTTTQGNTYNASTSNNSGTMRGYPEIGWVVLDGDADMDDIVQRNQRTTSGYNGGEANYPDNDWNNGYLNGVGNAGMYSVALGKTPADRTAIMDLTENSTRKDSAISNNGNYTLYDYTGKGTGTTGYNADCYEEVSPTSTCGEYAAICVTSTGYPVVVYFDVDHKMLKVARGISTNPKGINTRNADETSKNDGASAWRIQQVALSDGHLGNDASYVSAVIDSEGYLHIAFQNSRGELVYTRSTNTAAALTLDQGFTFAGSVIVDTNGTWASITVDSNNVPQIAYMANTSGYDTLKLAYPVESATAPWTAATTWETMYAPMNAKSSNVKTCVVARPSNATGGQVANLSTYWKTGIGFATSEDYRVMKYIGSGTKTY